MDNNDNLTPAINLEDEEMPNEMTANEFQQKLYTWFEDRGLLSELRAHLRRQMIGVLKDTALGRTVSTPKQTVSPKLQALNLLIAEFLLRQDYHYSLSVFSTEVPLISVLPECPNIIANGPTSTKTKEANKWRFSHKDTRDILETLGISPDISEGKQIFHLYYKGLNKEPLLTCIVRTINLLHSSQTHHRNLIDDDEPEEDEENGKRSQNSAWIQTLKELLISNNVKNVDEISTIVKIIIEKEQKRLEQVAREEFVKLELNLQAEMDAKHAGDEEKNMVGQKIVEEERIKFDNDVAAHQNAVKAFKTHVKEKKMEFGGRWEKVLTYEREVLVKEQTLLRSGRELDERRRKLDDEYKELVRERKEITDLRQRIDRQTAERKAQREEQKWSVRQLQMENDMLKELNTDQRVRMEALSGRADLLIRDLDVNLGIFRNSGNSSPRNNKVNGGAGEEGSRPATTSPREFRNFDGWKRRIVPPRRLTIHSSSGSDERSPTDDVLQDARERLRRLERESEEADRHYREFYRKHGLQQIHYCRKKSPGSFGPCTTASIKEAGGFIREEIVNSTFGISAMENPISIHEYHSIPMMESEVIPQPPQDRSPTNTNSECDDRSVASSGVLGGIMAYGMSNVSFSEVEVTTEDKSKSPDNNI